MRSIFFIYAALAFAVTNVQAEEQLIPAPSEGWALRMNAPKLEQSKGDVPAAFYGKADRLQVSLFVEAPRCSGGNSDEKIYECFANSLKRNPIVKWETERANTRPKGGVMVMYMTQSEVDGKINSAFNINILFAKNGKWADLHTSITAPTRDDIKTLLTLAESVSIEEASDKK
jgi:hypothetical protein